MSAFTHIRKDAQAEEIIIERIDEDGAPLLSSDDNYRGSIELTLNGYGGIPGETSPTDLGCKGSDGKYHRIYLQEVTLCVGGATKKAIFLCSDPYTP